MRSRAAKAPSLRPPRSSVRIYRIQDPESRARIRSFKLYVLYASRSVTLDRYQAVTYTRCAAYKGVAALSPSRGRKRPASSLAPRASAGKHTCISNLRGIMTRFTGAIKCPSAERALS